MGHKQAPSNLRRRHILITTAGLFFLGSSCFLLSSPWSRCSTIPPTELFTDAYGPFEPPRNETLTPPYLSAIANACSTTVWRNDSWIVCDKIPMGLMNAKNKLQTCVRIAIDAGLGLILPTLKVRNSKTLAFDCADAPEVPLSYVFDETGMRAMLGKNCPQMPIGDGDLKKRLREDPETMKLEWRSRKPIFGPGEFEAHLNKMIDSTTRPWYETIGGRNDVARPTLKSSTASLLFSHTDTLMIWERTSDSAEFQLEFPMLFPFAYPLRKLAETIGALLPPSYVAVHARFEDDILYAAPPFALFESKMMDYLADVPSNRDAASGVEDRTSRVYLNTAEDETIVYVACGQAEVLDRLRRKFESQDRKWKVINKWDLIEGISPELKRFAESLGWDQLAVVDYFILLNAKRFFGVAYSTFSISAAHHREARFSGRLDGNQSQSLLVFSPTPEYISYWWY